MLGACNWRDSLLSRLKPCLTSVQVCSHAGTSIISPFCWLFAPSLLVYASIWIASGLVGYIGVSVSDEVSYLHWRLLKGWVCRMQLRLVNWISCVVLPFFHRPCLVRFDIAYASGSSWDPLPVLRGNYTYNRTARSECSKSVYEIFRNREMWDSIMAMARSDYDVGVCFCGFGSVSLGRTWM